MFPLTTAMATLVPSLDDVMPYQICSLSEGLTSVHVSPEFVDVQMLPLGIVAASLVPSLDIVISLQFCTLGSDSPSFHVSLSVHVHPESDDTAVQMFPLIAVAASLVPSLDIVILCQLSVPDGVLGVTSGTSFHVFPESVDVQTPFRVSPFPPQQTTAASLVPSLDIVIPLQSVLIAF